MELLQTIFVHGLRTRPVRSLASDTWLLAASEKIDACHDLWGRSTVLIAPVATATPIKPTVVSRWSQTTVAKDFFSLGKFCR